MFRRPQPFPINAITPFAAVDQGSIFGVSGHDRLTDERSTLYATAYDNVSSATDGLETLEPLAFQKSAGSDLSWEANQGISRNLSDCSVRTTEPPVTQRKPNGSMDILKHLERHVGGRATCLWLHESNHECGYSSQIDLVKRHIKRVHYCMR